MPTLFKPLNRIAAGSISPGEEGGPSFRMWILSDFSLISSCLTARSAFPYETEKAAALPVAKQSRLRPRTCILLGGHRYWCSETSGRSRKYGHKKCPELLLGRLSPPPERTALLCLAMAKVSKNPETCKRFREIFSFCNEFLSVLYVNALWRVDFYALKVVHCTVTNDFIPCSIYRRCRFIQMHGKCPVQ